ncbi:hypothetical protein HanXRQr2_Chr08g0356071 [Helianthus annuus]|uniref:Uncharacterized protein n=1 Tax=Helianthus annuus TaxID=4232 RepID=A0A251TIS4_HELAN|nr:hypothetical protein HanXRQr2_Chr08g0356071 [Helianthus annuus]KAJ0540071.1 hypothetical protein HanHA300_Chr08g0294061 [Helianthus annuus]KAJ0548480.1 hypothetical protein HanIR_Chr08g0384311 [Helianthus annuus]KAJ0554810.1 hypothetical protein HanHA89_Chr08g0312531 [Helianthus annuus]KAJ0720377.1 hypothetical protein HanLR1_Chr08g0292871 [Helianthus annuus]
MVHEDFISFLFIFAFKYDYMLFSLQRKKLFDCSYLSFIQLYIFPNFYDKLAIHYKKLPLLAATSKMSPLKVLIRDKAFAIDLGRSLLN